MSAGFGLKARAFKPSRRWAVDNLDYARTLPEDAKAWLEKFNREFYDADFRGGDALHATDELRRSCYATQNAAHRDVYSRGAVQCEESAWLERQANSSIRPESQGWEATDKDGQLTFPF